MCKYPDIASLFLAKKILLDALSADIPISAVEISYLLELSYKFLDNTEGFSCRKAIISRAPVEADEVEVIMPEGLLGMAEQIRHTK